MISFEWFRDAGEKRVCIVRDSNLPGLQIAGAVELAPRGRLKMIVHGRSIGVANNRGVAESLIRSRLEITP